MFSRPVIAIELTPVSLDVMIVGKPDARVRTELDRAAWENTWSGGLRALDEPLKAAMRRLGVGPKAKAIVIYPGPDAVADLITVRSSASEALAAATLSLRDSGLDGNGPVAVRLFDTSGHGKGVQTRVIAAGDTAIAAEAVADWIRRAGLRLDGMTSARAAVLASAMKQCESICSGDHVVVELHEHATGVVGISAGRVSFARVLSFGFDLLMEAIARGARDVTRGGDMPLSRAELRDILFQSGVPVRGDILNEKLGLRGEHVLPLLHPVLQRFAVEVRQTLRFAKIDGSADTQSVIISGPGCSIKNVAGVFADFVDAPVELCPSRDDSTVRSDSIFNTVLGFRLMYAPASELDARGERLVRRGVQVGAVAAAAMLAVSAGEIAHQLHLQQDRLDRLRPAITQLEDNRAARREFAELLKNVRLDEGTLRQALGERVCWASAVADVSRTMTRSVTLLEVAGSMEPRSQDRDGGPMLSIKGFAPVANDTVGADPADALAEGLRSSRVLGNVEFTSSRVIQSDDGGTRQFILSARPLSVPAMIAIGGRQ